MALKSLFKSPILLSCLLLPSIIEAVVASDPVDPTDPAFWIFYAGTGVTGVLGIPFGLLGMVFGIPLVGLGLIGMIFGDASEEDYVSQPPAFPTVCSAGIILISRCCNRHVFGSDSDSPIFFSQAVTTPALLTQDRSVRSGHCRPSRNHQRSSNAISQSGTKRGINNNHYAHVGSPRNPAAMSSSIEPGT